VNIPADVNTTVTRLPRCQDELQTIKLNLKRTMGAKHPYMSEAIRPLRVMRVGKWLFANGPLYKEANVEFDTSWTSLCIPDESVEEDLLACPIKDVVPVSCGCIMHAVSAGFSVDSTCYPVETADVDGSYANAFYVILSKVVQYNPSEPVENVVMNVKFHENIFGNSNIDSPCRMSDRKSASSPVADSANEDSKQTRSGNASLRHEQTTQTLRNDVPISKSTESGNSMESHPVGVPLDVGKVDGTSDSNSGLFDGCPLVDTVTPPVHIGTSRIAAPFERTVDKNVSISPDANGVNENCGFRVESGNVDVALVTENSDSTCDVVADLPSRSSVPQKNASENIPDIACSAGHEHGRVGRSKTRDRFSIAKATSLDERTRVVARVKQRKYNLRLQIKRKYARMLRVHAHGKRFFFTRFRTLKKCRHMYRNCNKYCYTKLTRDLLSRGNEQDTKELNRDPSFLLENAFSKLYVCLQQSCLFVTSSYAELTDHMSCSHCATNLHVARKPGNVFRCFAQTQKEIGSVSYICSVCSCRMEYENDLVHHIQSSHNVSPFYAPEVVELARSGVRVPVFGFLNTEDVVLAEVFNSEKNPSLRTATRFVVGVPAILRCLLQNEQLFDVRKRLPANNVDMDAGVRESVTFEAHAESGDDLNFYMRVNDEHVPRDASTETDTLLTGRDFLEVDERHKVFSVAPGEGMSPLSIFSDNCAEERAFPEIWLGQRRPTNTERLRYMTYGLQCKTEIRNSDRRVAQNVDNLFFKVKKLQMKILLSSPTVAVRKFKRGKTKITACEAKKASFVDKLVRRDEGYAFLKNLRGSPPYFEQAKKDLFAMIRQLGAATFFCSFSSAETKWKHLLRILGKVNDGVDYTDDEIDAMTWETICRLVRSDPVTCARHFDYQLRHFIYGFLMDEAAPIGIVQDWFYRVEMQNRGSCHAHFIIWIVDAPKYGVAKDEEVTRFIDRYVSCQKPAIDDPLRELVDRQVHRHSKACQTRRGFCRFHYPQPPMLKTSILKPLESDAEGAARAKSTWRKLYKYLNDLKMDNPFTMADMLNKFNLSHDEYIAAVRSSIKTETIFLKRELAEIRVNNYNEPSLRAWRANMDIQFITDIYQCAMYVVSYVSKAHRGISEVLLNATKEAKDGNFTLKETFRHIANSFTNSVEISAQEAVYILLGMPMRHCSRKVQFINTSPPEDRVRLLKPMNVIQQLEDDDEDVITSNMITRYAGRPKALEDVCLADWAAYYDGCKDDWPTERVGKRLAADGFPDEQLSPEDNEDAPCKEEITQASYRNPARRKIPRIIRPVWFSWKTEKEKAYRELLMLFLPWRDEEKELLRSFDSFEEHFRNVRNTIESKLAVYSPHHAIFQDVLDSIQNISVDDDLMFQFAPNDQQNNIDDQTALDEASTYEDPPEPYDIGQDMGITVNLIREEELVRNRETSDDNFRGMVRRLNKEQREIFDHILNAVKTSREQQCIFVTGGAGVGKTFFIHTLYQALLKFYDHLPGADFNTMKVLLTAPTGKAAYNIRGNTIHSTLALSGRGGPHVKDLTFDTLARLRNKLGDIKFLIIDEISMVGTKMLNLVNDRLQQLQKSNRPFGGVHVLAVGDLYQLQPVCDTWIFQNDDNMYNALASNRWIDNFKMFELTEVMRQKDDIFFAKLLNRLRIGKHTPEDVAILNGRRICETDKEYSLDIPHAFFMNTPRQAFNAAALGSMDGRLHVIHADDSVIGGHHPDLVAHILNNLPVDDTRRTMRLHKTFETKVGHKAEIVLNVDTEDGLVNGAPCDVMHVQYSHSANPKPSVVWVMFDKEDTGRQTRRNNARLYSEHVDLTWTPILPVVKRFTAPSNRTIQVQRRQFPLSSAHGRTVHRLQGATLDKLVCSIVGKNHKPPPHIHYVAFSRVTKLENLHILAYDPTEIKVDSRVTLEMQRLRSEARLNTIGNPFNTSRPPNINVICLNCTSLYKHIDDVRADRRILSADLCFFTESRVRLSDREFTVQLDKFEHFVHEGWSASKHTRSHYGTVVYTRRRLCKGFPRNHTYKGLEVTEVRIDEKPFHIFLGVYRSPTASLELLVQILTEILTKLDDRNTVTLMGDFNSDLVDGKPSKLLKQSLCDRFGMVQLIQHPTTDMLTTIDHIYTYSTSLPVKTGTFEMYFSYHKALWAIV
jgi:hypothetical protein